MNLNLSASLNIFKLISNPSLCLPHAIIPTFRDLPTPLDSAFQKDGKKVNIQAVVLDKDDCFAIPETNEVHVPYKVSCHGPFECCRISIADRFRNVSKP